MSEKLSKKISKLVPRLRFPKGFRKAQKSFSVPKNLRENRFAIQKAGDKHVINQTLDSKSSYETVCSTDAVTSLEDISFLSDSEESTNGGEDYSSIEVPRSACAVYSNISFDDLVSKPVDVKEFNSDPFEFFIQNQPIALSTPIKNTNLRNSNHLTTDLHQSFRFAKPVACSTPRKQSTSSIPRYVCEDSDLSFSLNKPAAYSKLLKQSFSSNSRYFFEDHKDLKPFNNCTEEKEKEEEEEEETMIGEPKTSFTSLSGGKDEVTANLGMENWDNISMLLHIPLEEIPEIFESEEPRMGLNENHPIPKEGSSNEDTIFKAQDVQYDVQENVIKKDPISKCNSDSKIEKKKHLYEDKRNKDVSICCLSVPSNHLKPLVKTAKKGLKNHEPGTRALEILRRNASQCKTVASGTQTTREEYLQKKGLMNVSVCCLGALECALQSLNMDIPTVSVKNALRAKDLKTTAQGAVMH